MPFGVADLPELDAELMRLVQSGARISFVSGNFNVVHTGHLRLFKFAAEIGEALVIGVNPDNTPGVTVPSEFRLEGVQSISIVTHAFVLTSPLRKVIAALRPAFVVKGKEFEGRSHDEEEAVKAYDGQVVYSSGEMHFSSVALLPEERRGGHASSVEKPLDFPQRHDFTIAEIAGQLAKFSGLRVLVVGDLIIDDYITCDPLGMSQEDPTIVVSPVETTTFVGGAGVVAGHARGLGAEVSYCSVVGADASADYARASLETQGIVVDFFPDATRPTTRKQRYRAHNKTLLRVNHLRQHAVGKDVMEHMLAAIEKRLPNTDVLLFSDFNYGCLPQPLVDRIVEMARRYNVAMSADSQSSSQMGDISRFKGMTLITPTEREARLAIHDFDGGLAHLCETLCERSAARNVVITLGSDGLIVWGDKAGLYQADRLPAFNSSPKDPAGAGDSLFTALSLALRSGVEIWESAYIGALAAAVQVSRVGNIPLTTTDLVAELNAPFF